ncbi:MAG: hypothetical protein KAT01_12450 [Candidatus Aminicenantes bacterium]|nr:hypothetical protein [Candidatus Aminicenantes bacterium]
MPKKNKHIPLVISILIGVVSIIYYLSYYKYFKIDVDEGLLINGALRVLSGELPLKDFHQYTMGRFYVLALWFLAFSKSVAVGRLFFVALHCTKNILAFHISRKIMPLPFSLIPSALLMIIPGFWNKAFVGVVLLVNALLILLYLRDPKQIRLVFLGLSVGFSVYFREDYAGYSFITVGLLILFLSIAEKEGMAEILKKWVTFGLSVLGAVLPMVLLYWMRDGLKDLVEGILQTIQLGHIESYGFKSPLLFLKWPIDIKNRDLGLSFSYLAILLFIVIGCILLGRFLKRRTENRTLDFSLLAVLMLAVFSFTHIWHWTHEFRIPQSGALIHILWAYLMALVFIQMKKTRKEKDSVFSSKVAVYLVVFVMALGVQVFLVFYSLFGHAMVQYDGGGISLRFGVHREIRGAERARILPPASQAVTYSKILKHISAHTSPEDRILCFGESPLYFLSDRKNATEFDNGRIPGYFPQRRKTFLAQIKTNKPKIIVLRKWEYGFWYDKMPEVLDHITGEYFLDKKIHNFYIFSSIDNVNIEVRRANAYYWKGQIEKAAVEYLRALETQNKNPDVQKILNRLFTNETTSQKVLNAFDGVYVQKTSEVWRLRWGNKPSPVDSGTIRFADPIEPKVAITKIEPFPRKATALDVAFSGDHVRFVSRASNNIRGLDVFFLESHPLLSIEIDLKRGEKAVQKAFVSGKGLMVTNGSIRLNKEKR